MSIRLLQQFQKRLLVHKVIHVYEPGYLSSLLTTNNKSKIASLKLTGNIDARDLRFIRDEMKRLAELDLLEVNIQEYNGIDGTCNFTALYVANEMPQNSFYDCYLGTPNTTLKSIVLPLSITKVGYSAFYRCVSLCQLTLPPTHIYIDRLAFYGCLKLSKVSLPSYLTTVGEATMFDNTNNLLVKINTTLNMRHDLHKAV